MPTEWRGGSGFVADKPIVPELDVGDGCLGRAVGIFKLEAHLGEEWGKGECYTFAVFLGGGMVVGIPKVADVRYVCCLGILGIFKWKCENGLGFVGCADLCGCLRRRVSEETIVGC